jgi:Na+/H+ antiporter NhaD/arsenite permease-like protein
LPRAAIGRGSISPPIRIGYTSLALFVIAYALVMTEKLTQLRKSKPVTLAAGFIWLLIGLVYAHDSGDHAAVLNAAEEVLIEYAEMLLFLLAAMTYVNTMLERVIFGELRAWLVPTGFGYRRLFSVTGIIAFFLGDDR